MRNNTIKNSLARGHDAVKSWFASPDRNVADVEALMLDLFMRMRQMCISGQYIDLEEIGTDEQGHLVAGISTTPDAPEALCEVPLGELLDSYSNLVEDFCSFLPEGMLSKSILLQEIIEIQYNDLYSDDLGRFIIPRLLGGYRDAEAFLAGYQTFEQCLNPELRDTAVDNTEAVIAKFKTYPIAVRLQCILAFFSRYGDEYYIGELKMTTDPDGSHPSLILPDSPGCYYSDWMVGLKQRYGWWTDIINKLFDIDSYRRACEISPMLGEVYFCAEHCPDSTYDYLGVSSIFTNMFARLKALDIFSEEEFFKGREDSAALYEKMRRALGDYKALTTKQRAELWLDFFRNTEMSARHTPPVAIHRSGDGEPRLELLPTPPGYNFTYVFAVILMEYLETTLPEKEAALKYREVINELRLLRGAESAKAVYEPLLKHIKDPHTTADNFFSGYRSQVKPITKHRKREWQELEERMGAGTDFRCDSRGFTWSERTAADTFFTSIRFAVRKFLHKFFHRK